MSTTRPRCTCSARWARSTTYSLVRPDEIKTRVRDAYARVEKHLKIEKWSDDDHAAARKTFEATKQLINETREWLERRMRVATPEPTSPVNSSLPSDDVDWDDVFLSTEEKQEISPLPTTPADLIDPTLFNFF